MRTNVEQYLKQLKLRKSGFKCEICGITTEEYWKKRKRNLMLHHKDNNHLNNVLSNYQIVCQTCHNKIHNSLPKGSSNISKMIQTMKGRKEDKNGKIIKTQQLIYFFVGQHRTLSRIIRYSTRLRSFDESVANHTFFVTLYSMIIADILIAQKYKIDKNKIITRALLHDFPEQASGDVIKVFKEKLSKEFHDLENTAMIEGLKHLPSQLIDNYLLEWQHGSADIEGKIVKIADDLSGLLYCYESIQMGNPYFYSAYRQYYVRLIKQTSCAMFKFLRIEIQKIKLDKARYANKQKIPFLYKPYL